MAWIQRQKFFNRYLPMFLSVVLLLVAGFVWIFFNKNVQVTQAGWYSTGGTWGYRKQITIDHTKVGVGTTTPLSNFPMLFSVTDTDFKFTSYGGGVASSTGLDILFTSSDGTTKLDHEMEYYASSTGQLISWVRIPSLSPTVDTVIYVYFGNASASNQTNMTGVWDSNYKGVWHLPNGTTLSATDSTSNSRNGTLVNTPTSAAGQIDGAANGATASHQYISFSDTGLPSGSGARTVSGWVKETSFAGTSVLLFYGTSGSSHQMSDMRFSATNVYFEGWSDDMNYAGTINTGTWYYITGTFDGTNGRIYVNGSLAAGPTALAWNTVLNGTGYIGHNTFDGQGDMNGARDEIRISNIARNADWIKTEYNNQNSPGTFYSYSGNQVEPATVIPAFVKEVGNTNIGASSALCTINVPAGGVALGNLIVGVATSESGQDISSVTDSRGNSYTVSALTFNAAGTDWGQNVFYGRATTALQSGDTITVTFLNSYFDAKICRALEYSGIASSGFFDGSSVGLDDAFPQSSTGSTGSVSSTGSNDLLVVFCSAGTNPITWTNTANFSSRGSTINAGSLSVYSEDRIASSSGSYSAGPGLSASQYWICHILAFKAAPFSNNSSINIRGGGGQSVKARAGGGSSIKFR